MSPAAVTNVGFCCDEKQVEIDLCMTSYLSGEPPVGEKIYKGSRKMEGVLHYEEGINPFASLRNG
jgi:hypothetical protein